MTTTLSWRLKLHDPWYWSLLHQCPRNLLTDCYQNNQPYLQMPHDGLWGLTWTTIFLVVELNKMFLVVESSACYHLLKLRLDRAVQSVHYIFRLELDPDENLGWHTRLNHHLKSHPELMAFFPCTSVHIHYSWAWWIIENTLPCVFTQFDKYEAMLCFHTMCLCCYYAPILWWIH